MQIFDEDARKEIRRFLPHYIVGSAFITLSIVLGGYITNEIIMPRQHFDKPPVNEAQQQAQEEVYEGLLPSEYKIGKPFKDAIKDTSKPLFVEFYADWCPHSRKLTPVVSEISEMMDDVNFTTVDAQAEENLYLTKKYKVDKFPYVIIIDTKTGNYNEMMLNTDSFNVEGLQKQLKKKLHPSE